MLPRSLFVLLLCGSLHAEKLDITQSQFKAKPKPEWLKPLVDQGKKNEKLKGYQAPEGVKLDIIAEAPLVVNPVGMAFSNDGTLYVIEWRAPKKAASEEIETVKYKDGSTRKFPRLKKETKDVIKKLIDTNNDGVYDKAEIILEENLPSSILFHNEWMLVAGQGNVRRYKVAELGVGKTPKAEIIAKGFGGFFHSQVSGLTISNDGSLFITVGEGDHYVEGSDGSRVNVRRTGAVFRCRADGSKMQVYAIGFRNPYRGVALDATFNLFHMDNDSGAGARFTGCRLMYIPEAADFGWRLKEGERGMVPDPIRAAGFGELPGKMPALLKTGKGGPAGVLIYNESQFPEQYRGLIYYPDLVRRSIRAYKPQPDGGTFAITEEFTFLKSNDPLFRPCQMVVGPDGSMLLLDWRSDFKNAGHWGDGKHGRIYRLSWANQDKENGYPLRGRDSWAKLLKMKDEELREKLYSVDFSIRLKAQQELVRRKKSLLPLLKLFEDEEEPMLARIAALGALQSNGNVLLDKACVGQLNDIEPDLRRLAIEALGLMKAAKGTKAIGLLIDNDLAVARTAGLALARTGAAGIPDIIASTLANDDSGDRFFQDGLARALEMLGKKGVDTLRSLAESGDKKQTDLAADVFLGLRSREAAKLIPRLLVNPHVDEKERARLVRSYTNYLLTPPVSLDPLIEYLEKKTDEKPSVKLATLQLLAFADDAKSKKIAKWLMAMTKEKEPSYQLPLAQALGRARVKEAMPYLKKVLQGEAKSRLEVTHHLLALRSLGQIDEKEARPVAMNILKKSKSEELRAAAKKLVERRGKQ